MDVTITSGLLYGAFLTRLGVNRQGTCLFLYAGFMKMCLYKIDNEYEHKHWIFKEDQNNSSVLCRSTCAMA